MKHVNISRNRANLHKLFQPKRFIDFDTTISNMLSNRIRGNQLRVGFMFPSQLYYETVNRFQWRLDPSKLKWFLDSIKTGLRVIQVSPQLQSRAQSDLRDQSIHIQFQINDFFFNEPTTNEYG